MQQKRFSAILEKVGRGLGVLRIKKGYENISQFTSQHKLPMIQYWRIENGKANITLRSLFKILAIHDLTVPEFFCWLRTVN